MFRFCAQLRARGALLHTLSARVEHFRAAREALARSMLDRQLLLERPSLDSSALQVRFASHLVPRAAPLRSDEFAEHSTYCLFTSQVTSTRRATLTMTLFVESRVIEFGPCRVVPRRVASCLCLEGSFRLLLLRQNATST